MIGSQLKRPVFLAELRSARVQKLQRMSSKSENKTSLGNGGGMGVRACRWRASATMR